MRTRLILWDIDGTLIQSGGAGEHALLLALSRHYKIEGTLDWLEYYGRTDRWIAREILARYGLPADPTDCQRYIEAYLSCLPETLPNPRSRLLPGVQVALEACARSGVATNALLTGNMERGAIMKLAHVGVDRFFTFGAFADDSEFRNDLGPIALRRARERLGLEIQPSEVVVIGDTPHDIECGRIFGARTVAVATGRYTQSELATHRPDHLLPDLADLTATLAALGVPQNAG